MKNIIIPIVLLLASVGAFAQTIAIQGVLRDRDLKGRALDDGYYNVVFKIYDQTTGGSALWTETYSSLKVENGVFQTNLGTQTPLTPLHFDKTYYVGIAVEGEVEMSPRLEMGTFPYAMAINGTTNKFPSSGNVVIAEDSLVLTEGILKLEGPNGKIQFNDGTSLNTASFSGPAGSIANPSVVSISSDADGTGDDGGVSFEVNGQVRASINNVGAFRVDDGTGSINYATGSGDLYVRNDLEVDGSLHPLNIYTKTLGRIGIGTTTPEAPLDVRGSSTNEFGFISFSSFYFASTTLTNSSWGGSNYPGQIGAVIERQLVVGDQIFSAQLVSYSDARIKNIKGISNSKSDLDVLKQIEITDYEYIDQIQRMGSQKKVIAQQVKEVFPQAVTLTTKMIPSVYETSSDVIYKDGQLIITTTKAHDFAKGDKVTVYASNKNYEKVAVLEVLSPNTFVIAGEAADQAFVYGKVVDDFHSVDYEAIAMLNVSATQELYRKIKALEAANVALTSRLTNYEQLEKEVATLKSLEAKVNLLLETNTKVGTVKISSNNP